MKKILLPILILICFSCDRPEITENPPSAQKIKLTGGVNDTSCSLDSLWTNLESIPLGNSSIPIGEIDKVYITQNDIIVLDKNISQSVHFFDRAGTFKHSLTKSGKGPGEFMQIQDITFDPFSKSLHLYDRAQEKILIYTLSGKFLNERRFPYYFKHFEVCGEGKYAIYKNTAKNDYVEEIPDADYQLLNHHLLITDHKGKLISGYFAEKNDIKETPIENLKPFSIAENGITFSSLLSNDIFSINGNEVKESFSLDFGDKTVPRELFPLTASQYMNLTSKYYFGIFNLVKTQNHLFFSYTGKGNGFTHVLYNTLSGQTSDCIGQHRVNFSLHPVVGNTTHCLITYDQIHEIRDWSFEWEGKIGEKMKSVASWAEDTKNYNPVLFLFYPK